VAIKNTVLWDATPCGFSKNHVSEKHIASLIGVTRISELEITLSRCVLQLLITANGVPSPPILVTLMMEAIRRFLQEPQDVTSQKTELFTVTVTKISNVTRFIDTFRAANHRSLLRATIFHTTFWHSLLLKCGLIFLHLPLCLLSYILLRNVGMCFLRMLICTTRFSNNGSQSGWRLPSDFS
jgi:hypothetical protein